MGEEALGTRSPIVQSLPWPGLHPECEFFRKAEYVRTMRASGILGFISASFVTDPLQNERVVEFVESYQSAECVRSVQGKQFQFTSESVGQALKLPSHGVSCSSLKQDDHPFAMCFSTELVAIPPEEQQGPPIRFLKTQLTREWREVVEFVQRWLFLYMNPYWVEMGTVVAAVAVFEHGVAVN